MGKISKEGLTKEEWRAIKEQKRQAKEQKRLSKQKKVIKTIPAVIKNEKVAFVLGNGISRKPIDLNKLQQISKIYGCNALYREFNPDYLIAVDTKMILEITRTGYQKDHEVWTNPNKVYSTIENLNFFTPSRGWSSGPTALDMAARHGYDEIYILGFDYQGVNNKVNNIYADTQNYKRSTDNATYYGNWLRQTTVVLEQNPDIKFYRVINEKGFISPKLKGIKNLDHIQMEEFRQKFNL